MGGDFDYILIRDPVAVKQWRTLKAKCEIEDDSEYAIYLLNVAEKNIAICAGNYFKTKSLADKGTLKQESDNMSDGQNSSDFQLDGGFKEENARGFEPLESVDSEYNLNDDLHNEGSLAGEAEEENLLKRIMDRARKNKKKSCKSKKRKLEEKAKGDRIQYKLDNEHLILKSKLETMQKEKPVLLDDIDRCVDPSELEIFETTEKEPYFRTHGSLIDPKTGRFVKPSRRLLEKAERRKQTEDNPPKAKKEHFRTDFEKRNRDLHRHPLLPPCDKRHFQCQFLSLDATTRHNLNRMFWLSNRQARGHFLMKCIEVVPIARHRVEGGVVDPAKPEKVFKRNCSKIYKLPDKDKNMQQVCVNMFKSVLGLTSKTMIDNLLNKLKKYSIEEAVLDNRGGGDKVAKDESFIANHIRQFDSFATTQVMVMYNHFKALVNKIEDVDLRHKKMCSYSKYAEVVKKLVAEMKKDSAFVIGSKDNAFELGIKDSVQASTRDQRFASGRPKTPVDGIGFASFVRSNQVDPLQGWNFGLYWH